MAPTGESHWPELRAEDRGPACLWLCRLRFSAQLVGLSSLFVEQAQWQHLPAGMLLRYGQANVCPVLAVVPGPVLAANTWQGR